MVIRSKYSMEKGGVSGGEVWEKKGGEKPRKHDQLNFNFKKMGREGEKKIIFGKEGKMRVKTNIRND